VTVALGGRLVLPVEEFGRESRSRASSAPLGDEESRGSRSSANRAASSLQRMHGLEDQQTRHLPHRQRRPAVAGRRKPRPPGVEKPQSIFPASRTSGWPMSMICSRAGRNRSGCRLSRGRAIPIPPDGESMRQKRVKPESQIARKRPSPRFPAKISASPRRQCPLNQQPVGSSQATTIGLADQGAGTRARLWFSLEP